MPPAEAAEQHFPIGSGAVLPESLLPKPDEGV
jgi:hypothetical protein